MSDSGEKIGETIRAQSSVEHGIIVEGRFLDSREQRIMAKFGLGRVGELEEMIAETAATCGLSVDKVIEHLDSYPDVTDELPEQPSA